MHLSSCGHLYCGICTLGRETAATCSFGSCRKEIGADRLYSIPYLKGRSGEGRRSSKVFVSQSSPKFDAILKYLKNIPTFKSADGSRRAREKVLIFSQWTSCLDMLQPHLVHAGYKYARLDGTMQLADREKQLAMFKKSPSISVLLLSLMASACGLNITEATHVLLVDGWWNPSVEDQAVDRTHRIGQTKPVSVVRFVTEDTIEFKLIELQEKKRAMIKDIMYGCSVAQKPDTTEENLADLFGVNVDEDEEDEED